MNIQFSETQKSILIAAAERADHQIDWFPEGVNGGARAKVLGSLRNKGLIEIRDDQPVISPAGLAALGLPATPTEPAEAMESSAADSSAPDAPKARKTRENTKQATVIALLRRPEGATLEQLVETTGWQRHTVRGALSLLGKKQGLTIGSEKTQSGRLYRIGGNPVG
jgi:hypothetical protein